MTATRNAALCICVLAFLTCESSGLFTSSFFTMRKGPRNPFRILASVVERGTAMASGNDANAPARKSDIRLRDEKGLDVGVQRSSRRARSNRRRYGAPVISSFLLRSVPMIYWTHRNHSKTCVQEYGFGIRFDGGNVFPNLEVTPACFANKVASSKYWLPPQRISSLLHF